MNEALISMATEGYIPVIEHLLNIGADIHADEDAALFAAVKGSRSETIKYLLQKGADINAQDGSIVLHAVMFADVDIVQFLVEHNADQHYGNDLPIWVAAEYAMHAKVLYLLGQGAVVVPRKNAEKFKNAKKNIPCYNLLYQYSGHSIAEVYKILMDKKIRSKSPSRRNYYGGKVREIVEYFPFIGWKETRDETQMTQKDKNNALNVTIVDGNLEMVIYLREIGANIHTVDNYLFLNAIINGHYEIVRYLIKEGIDINAPINKGAYIEAIMGDDLEMVRLLVELGLDFSYNDYAPARYALERNSAEIVSFFEKLGVRGMIDTSVLLDC